MSGIFGFFNKENYDELREKNINSMAIWNNAYGNTGDKVYSSSDISLGCFVERISKDVPVGEPVLDNGKWLAVIDAVLYNRKELINALEKCTEKTLSDEEVLLEYLDKYGFEALAAVNGDFAGAIYVKQDRSLVLFRDHMGIRPLFFSCGEWGCAFSTDIRGIISLPFVKAEISEEWIYKILSGYLADGTKTTEYTDIFCVEPGSYMRICCKEQTLVQERKRYWTLGNKKIKLPSDNAYQKKLRELIEDSVRRRLNAVTGTVGAELSGGLDSGVIDILVNRQGRNGLYYSWSWAPEVLEMAENDERLIIQDICNQEGINCNYGSLDMGEYSHIWKKYNDMGIGVNYEEFPVLRFVFPPYINALTITQTSEFMHQAGVKVVFTGHGGDEGVSHRCNPYEMLYYKEYYHYLRYMFSTTKWQKNRIKLTFEKIAKNFKTAKDVFKRPFVSGIRAPKLLNDEFAARFKNVDMPLLYFAFDPIKYIMNGGSRNRLDNIALLGAYSGVRYLVPYLDYRVVDYAVSIPRYQFLRGRKDRYVFREAFKDIMPDSLYRLRTKEDFSRRNIKPDPNWFKSFEGNKKMVISSLNRDFWSKYLDFDMIDKFEKSGEPTEEEKGKEVNMLTCLMQCAMAKNLVDKVKGMDKSHNILNEK